MAEKYIWVKLTKEWGGFKVGDVVRFGESKGRGRIANGEGYEVDAPKSKRPKAETATVDIKAETAEVTPKKQSKKEINKKGKVANNGK